MIDFTAYRHKTRHIALVILYFCNLVSWFHLASRHLRLPVASSSARARPFLKKHIESDMVLALVASVCPLVPNISRHNANCKSMSLMCPSPWFDAVEFDAVGRRIELTPLRLGQETPVR